MSYTLHSYGQNKELQTTTPLSTNESNAAQVVFWYRNHARACVGRRRITSRRILCSFSVPIHRAIPVWTYPTIQLLAQAFGSTAATSSENCAIDVFGRQYNTRLWVVRFGSIVGFDIERKLYKKEQHIGIIVKKRQRHFVNKKITYAIVELVLAKSSISRSITANCL